MQLQNTRLLSLWLKRETSASSAWVDMFDPSCEGLVLFGHVNWTLPPWEEHG